VQQLAQQGGFSCSDLAGDDNEALLGFDAVAQRGERFEINGIGIKKTGIRSNAEG
jgi:hypothetical protein